MADSYSKILVHCVFSTKNRLPQIAEPGKLWSYLRGIARNRNIDTLAVGGTANHVHMLITLPRDITISNLMRDLKANSSRYLNEKRRGFRWQDGFAAISVSPSQLGAVKKYIETQEQHHTHRSFESEYVALLDKSGVNCSPEYTLG